MWESFQSKKNKHLWHLEIQDEKVIVPLHFSCIQPDHRGVGLAVAQWYCGLSGLRMDGSDLRRAPDPPEPDSSLTLSLSCLRCLVQSSGAEHGNFSQHLPGWGRVSYPEVNFKATGPPVCLRKRNKRKSLIISISHLKIMNIQLGQILNHNYEI